MEVSVAERFVNDPQAISHNLANFAIQSNPIEIEAVLEVLKKGTLDYVGLVSFAAQNVESSRTFISAVQALSAPGPATVIGCRSKLQAQYSALLNGTLAHSMDFDDTHIASALHPGAPVISAAFAQAELEDSQGRVVSGRLYYESLAVGYEIMCRLGVSISATLHRVGFHPTGVLGIYGAAAAAGRIAGLDLGQMEALFGIVGSMASGSMQYLDNGSWNKRIHPGLAAHNALLGVQLAKAGMVGATRSIEGEFGLLSAYGRIHSPDPRVTAGLGTIWESNNTAIKPYASCRLTHAAIDAIYDHRQEATMGRTPKTIEVQFSKKGYMIFSVYYHVAVAWLHGRNDWTAYDYLGHEDVEDLCARIVVTVDDSIPDESLKTVVTVDGKPVSIEHPLGEPETPVTREVNNAKFYHMAKTIYGEQIATEIIKSMDSLIDSPSIVPFLQRLQGQ